MIGVEIYEDLVDYVLYRFQLSNLNYRVILLSDTEFEIFNYECDVVKSFYYMIMVDNDFDNGKKHDNYYEMITKEYGEFFYQSEGDSYISAALVHVNKVYNTISPVYNAIKVLNENNGTDKDISFLNALLTENSDQEYLLLLRKHHGGNFGRMHTKILRKWICLQTSCTVNGWRTVKIEEYSSKKITPVLN